MSINKDYTKDNVDLICNELERRIKHLHYVINGIKFYGLEKMQTELVKLKIQQPLRIQIKGVKHIDVNLGNKNNIKINFIKKLVIAEYKNSNVDLFDIFNVGKRGKNIEARDLIVLLILSNTKMTSTSVANYFSRSRQLIYAIKWSYKERLKNKSEYSNFLRTYNRLDWQIKSKYGKI